jgi:hypothetical protein
MLIALAYTFMILALGFGLGRVHHPASRTLKYVKAELDKMEDEGRLPKSKAIIARVRSLF